MAMSRSSQNGNLDPGPSMGSKRPTSSTILRRTAMPAPRPRTCRTSCMVVSMLSPVRTWSGMKPAVGSCSPASTLQTATATFGCVAKLEANFTGHFGGTVQSSSVIATTEPLVSVKARVERVAFTDGRDFHVPQARIGAEWLWGLKRLVVLALIKDDQLEIGMRVCQDGQYRVHHQATATKPPRHLQTNADISGASSCLSCPPPM
jgi:hypothetical protein